MLTSQQNKAQESSLQISERLFAIAESLPKNAIVCDVGSDHGYLPLYLLSSQRCRKVIVTDLNEMPLQRAKEALLAAGFQNQCDFYLTDGIEAILDQSPDVYVIAGMGGETIVGILNRALAFLPKSARFVLQPMTKLPELRQFLYENGFSIIGETVVLENNKFFPILSVSFTADPRIEDPMFYYFGKFLPKKKEPAVKAYFQMILKQNESIFQNKQKNGYKTCREEKRIEQIIRILEDFA